MSCTNTPLHNELLGAVIGLARTCANNPKTDDTDRLIFTALRVSANKSANEQTLAAMIRRVNEEKAIISPGCATCTARCGNTDNYDMSLLWNAPDEIREAKLSILENAQALAEKLMQTKSEEIPEGTIPRLYLITTILIISLHIQHSYAVLALHLLLFLRCLPCLSIVLLRKVLRLARIDICRLPQ